MKDLYFSHDQNAMSDPKILDLRGDYGMEGYGVYWGVIEALSREPDLTMPLSERRANALNVSMAPSFDMTKFIQDCIDYGLFNTDGERFWSDSLIRRFGAIANTSKRNSEAAKARWSKPGSRARQQQKPTAPAEPPNAFGDGPDMIDPEWKKVVDAYHAQIGQLPTGRSLETLVSFYEDLGADIMVHAIERTNQGQPTYPYKFLKSILDGYAEKNVKTVLEAQACDKDFDRKNAKRTQQKQQAENPPDDSSGEAVRWLG